MELLIVLQENIVDVKNKEKFAHKSVPLDKMLCEHWFFVIVMERSYLYFEAKLFWQILSFNQEVSFSVIVDSLAVAIVYWYLVKVSFGVLMVVKLFL